MENEKLEQLFEELSIVEVEDRLAFCGGGRCGATDGECDTE